MTIPTTTTIMENPHAFLKPQKAFINRGWAFRLSSFRRFPEVSFNSKA